MILIAVLYSIYKYLFPTALHLCTKIEKKRFSRCTVTIGKELAYNRIIHIEQILNTPSFSHDIVQKTTKECKEICGKRIIKK